VNQTLITQEHRERLHRLPVLLGADYSLTVLEGGLTNTNLLLEVRHAPSGLAPGQYVARLSNGGEDSLGVDRWAELQNSKAAAASGVGATVFDFSGELGVLLVGFLAGHTLRNESLTTAEAPLLLTRIATAIRQLHKGPPFSNVFDMFRRRDGYLKVVQENGIPIPPDYETYSEPWAEVRRVLEPLRTNLVPCNNDLLAGNFIDNGQRVWIIDYEYSGMNDPTFELGNAAAECELSNTQVEQLVAAYFGRSRDEDLAAVQLQSLCSEYGWSLWGFIQAALSPLNYDYRGWGEERLARARNRFESANFHQLIQTLT
jgi:thiamine kinase-like enzyme